MSKTTIDISEVIGFTRAPDGACYLNLKNFRQVLVSDAEWQKVKQAKSA